MANDLNFRIPLVPAFWKQQGHSEIYIGLFRNPKSAFRNSKGFTFLALLAAIIILGISLGAAGKYWQNVVQREKEEELLYRGDEYRRAIERYYTAVPGRTQYPTTLDDLLKDARTPQGKRYLRRKYKDPMTGEDFRETKDPLSNRITGVYSASDKKPFRQANFDYPYMEFAGKTKYSEWRFIANAYSLMSGTTRNIR
jgi:type II secretory pathway pseudopilin PulG